jgi:hypothetical protein
LSDRFYPELKKGCKDSVRTDQAFLSLLRSRVVRVRVMYRASKIIAIVILLAVASPTIAQVEKIGAIRHDSFDPVEFLKSFKVGMSYTEVQNALPKNAEQDILSYIVTDEVFVLTVDIPTRAQWTASFKFDTLESPLRRPERLVEMSCSATLSSRSDTFDSIVRKVTVAFGQPAMLERKNDTIQEAGWVVSGGSVLTLEYSRVPTGLEGKDVSVDFIVKKTRRRSSASKDIA